MTSDSGKFEQQKSEKLVRLLAKERSLANGGIIEIASVGFEPTLS